jgi:hypothetical protein
MEPSEQRGNDMNASAVSKLRNEIKTVPLAAAFIFRPAKDSSARSSAERRIGKEVHPGERKETRKTERTNPR